jgi:ABC-type uncharacterized transport system ATPase component
MTYSDNSVSYFGLINFRNKGTLFGIKQADRLSYMYVTGKTGTGKSTLLETLALQDIVHGRGMMLIDPHGDLAERVVNSVPAHRRQDVISRRLEPEVRACQRSRTRQKRGWPCPLSLGLCLD